MLCSMCCVCDEVGGEVKKEKLSKTKIPWELSLSFHDTYACGGDWTVVECLSHVCEIQMLCCLLENVCVAFQTQTVLFYYKLFVCSKLAFPLASSIPFLVQQKHKPVNRV